MVTRQVLRGLGLLSALAAPAAAAPGASPPAAPPRPRVGVIDLRVGALQTRQAARAEAAAALAARPELDAAVGDELLAALAGERPGSGLRDGRAALARAVAAYGRLDCAQAGAAASQAVDALVPEQAAGADVVAELTAAFIYRFLCADAGGDSEGAFRAAERLRALGADPPPQIKPDRWARYPGYDAGANVMLGEVNVDSDPAGADLWVNLRPAGRAPQHLLLAEGEHLVAAAAGAAAAARRVEVRARAPLTITLALPAVADRFAAARAQVAAWRAGAATDPAALASLLGAAGLRAALVLTDGDRVEAWACRRARARPAASAAAGPPTWPPWPSWWPTA